jgi:hypothetical protein
MFISGNAESRLDTPVMAAEVMVAVITWQAAPAMPAGADLARWKRLNPLAIWTQILLPTGPVCSWRAAMVEAVTAALNRRHMRSAQLILLGTGEAGRLALELVLEGQFACAGIVVIDVACGPLPSPIAPTTTAVRLVAHDEPGAAQQDGLVTALRGADIDERIIMLKPSGAHDAQTIASAAKAFLLELVATVSCRASNGV